MSLRDEIAVARGGAVVTTVAAAMLAELLFVRLTHAMQIDTHGDALPAAHAAGVAAQHQGALHTALMLGRFVSPVVLAVASSRPDPSGTWLISAGPGTARS
jgi:hypothetical protein